MTAIGIGQVLGDNPAKVLLTTVSVAALGAYGIYSLTRKSGFSIKPISDNPLLRADTTPAESDVIRRRLNQTYRYFSGSLLVTGATSFALFKSGYTHSLVSKHPIAFSVLSLCASVAGLLGIFVTNVRTVKQSAIKHASWMLFNMGLGANLSVLGFYGGGTIVQASMLTSIMMGSISYIAMTAPNYKYLAMGSVLSAGLSILNVSLWFEYLFPESNVLRNTNTVFSLLLFSGVLAYDTQKVLLRAQLHLDPETEEFHFYDPIREQLALYLDTVNIFVDLVKLLDTLKGKKKKKKKDSE